MPLTTLNFSSPSSFATGTVVKSQTKIISAFGDFAVAHVTNFQDVTGTEVTFSRTFSDSKILALWNLKWTSLANIRMLLNRKIGSGSYAIVNQGASGTQNGRTSAKQVFGALYNNISVNAMGYAIHAQLYSFLDESGEGLTDTTDAISYKITLSGSATSTKLHLNTDGYNNATDYNKVTESSVTFMEIKV